MLIITILLSGLLILPTSAVSSWSKPRPSQYTPYYETIGNEATDGKASLAMGVEVWDYVERPVDYPDVITFRMSISANTRGDIHYEWYTASYNWYTVSTQTNVTGDDSGNWLFIPFVDGVLFYGDEYTSVWVSSNGFLSFDYPSNSSTPESIPNMDKPNTVIAPFWRDLNPAAGGSITYGEINDPYLGHLFVISWNNVPNKVNQVAQTFQVVIRDRVVANYDYQNWIFFQYKTITKDYSTTVGIEDQTGNKGTSYDYNNLSNALSLKLAYPSPGYRLDRLKIRLSKSTDNNAEIDFLGTSIGGYNIVLKNSSDKYGSYYVDAIAYAVGLIPVAGILFGTLLITAETAGVLSGGLSPAIGEPYNAPPSTPEAWFEVYAREEGASYQPLDSTLAATIVWSFLDPNTLPHFLTITADATYVDLFSGSTTTLSTSVTLNMYINRPPNIPSTPSGSASVHAGAMSTYSTSTTDPDGDDIYYLFSWGDTSTTSVGPVASGVTVSASHTWNSTGTYGVKVKAYDGWLLTDWSPILTVTVTNPHGGGCPTLFVWNGTAYVDYGVINIHNPTGEDIIREVPVRTQDVSINNYVAKFRLREGWPGLNSSESVIDQVKLYAVDSHGNRHLCPLIIATHSRLGNVLPQLLASDDVRVQTLLLETIDLKFIVTYRNIQSFVFVIEGCNIYKEW